MTAVVNRYNFRIEGVTPLLIHADDVEKADMVSRWQMDPANKKLGKAGDDRVPPWTWQTRCYSDGKVLTVPTDNLSACLRSAGSMLILQGKKTFKESTQTGIVFVEDHLPILIDGKSQVVQVSDMDAMSELSFKEQCDKAREIGFDLFMKRAQVGGKKHVRVRARFDVWALEGTVETIAPEITTDILKQLFKLAGFYKGLCDWRPGSPKAPGRFGKFDAVVTKV